MFWIDLYSADVMTTLVEYFVKGWQRSFDYSGRSSRPEYWWFYLAYLIVGLLFLALSVVHDLFGKLFFL
jgi:uncharacterized membrane protein YhaH (DUF805 family)